MSSPAQLVECDVQRPVYLRLPLTVPESRENHVTKSGCQVIEVNIRSGCLSINQIVFRNNYTHNISIKYVPRSDPVSDPESWKYCLKDRVLMPNCHCETGSQNWFVYNLQLEAGIQRLRVILKQPSLNWINFGIKDIALYSFINSSAETDTHTTGGTDTHTTDPQTSMEIVKKMLQVIKQSHGEVIVQETSHDKI